MNNQLKILVVDDFSTMRRIVTNLLKQLGFTHIEQAADGKEAYLKMRQHGDFDLVVTDWNMPVMTGLELLKRVRQTPGMSHIPVLMVTAESKREQIIEAAKAGVNGYVVKPFTAETLKSKLDKIMERLAA